MLQPARATYVSLEKLLAGSDIISAKIPLNGGTKHLIGAKEIAKMKDGVVIANTAREAIIDEAAIADTLECGKIGAVGLDVYEYDPAINEKLMRQERVLLVPHLGTQTTETLAKMETWAVLAIALLSPVPEHPSLQ